MEKGRARRTWSLFLDAMFFLLSPLKLSLLPYTVGAQSPCFKMQTFPSPQRCKTIGKGGKLRLDLSPVCKLRYSLAPWSNICWVNCSFLLSNNIRSVSTCTEPLSSSWSDCTAVGPKLEKQLLIRLKRTCGVRICSALIHHSDSWKKVLWAVIKHVANRWLTPMSEPWQMLSEHLILGQQQSSAGASNPVLNLPQKTYWKINFTNTVYFIIFFLFFFFNQTPNLQAAVQVTALFACSVQQGSASFINCFEWLYFSVWLHVLNT